MLLFPYYCDELWAHGDEEYWGFIFCIHSLSSLVTCKFSFLRKMWKMENNKYKYKYICNVKVGDY